MRKETTEKSMLTHRKISLTAGLLYLLTFISIPTLSLYSAAKGADYILGSGPDTSAMIGGLSEIIVALAGIGTAVVLFPILKKQSETMALGLVASRILEASSIFVGVAFILTVVTLRRDGTGAEALPTSHTLVALYDRIFLLSQSFMPAINDLLLGLLLYKSRLVPRGLSLIGIIGAFPLIAAYLAVMLNVIELDSPLKALGAVLVALFELSLGLWLTIKGFNSKSVNRLQ